jgi:hypothetical protein
MGLNKVEPADFENWVTPKQALKSLCAALKVTRYIGADMLLKRLTSGLLIAAARHARHGYTLNRDTFLVIIPSNFEHIGEHDTMWDTGDTEYRIREFGAYETIARFDIRFDPAGLLEAMPGGSATPSATHGDDDTQGPPVSEADLRRWAEAYQAIYKDRPEATQDHALQSARGFFVGKSVSRQAVRDVIPAGKRGPRGPRNSGE